MKFFSSGFVCVLKFFQFSSGTGPVYAGSGHAVGMGNRACCQL